MKKVILSVALFLIMAISGSFGNNLMSASAQEKAPVYYNKCYTSIKIEDGDTLWSIAETYGEHSGKSTREYVRELRKMNSLSDDTIHAGRYLTVAYYEAE